ncbi:hypothetical protein CU669_20845, partial [Paramagnetospirillum kuznetsovii]
GQYGSFSVDANGAWSYQAGAHNELAANQVVSDSFTVAAADGTTTSVTVTLTGTNDAAVLSSATAALTETNAALSASGLLTISDVDSAATFVAQSGTAGQYGSFSVDANGAWSYQAGAHNEFTPGQTYLETFAVASADGTQTSVNVNIVGTNDVPVVRGDSATLGENLVGTFNVLANDSDPDAGDSLRLVSVSTAPGIGSVNIVDNQIVFTPNNASFDDLPVGGSRDVVINYTVADLSNATASGSLLVTVTGANDAPVAIDRSYNGYSTPGGLAAEKLVGANIALFDNGSFVDTSNGYWAESDNTQAALRGMGHTVSTFTGYAAGDFNAALAGKSVLVIPELEVGNLSASLSTDAAKAISDFVAGGGSLVLMADGANKDTAFLNRVFGFSVTDTDTYGSTFAKQSGAAGTTFGDDAASVPTADGTYPISAASLPPGSKVLFANGNEVGAALMPFGNGQVSFIAYDMFDARPVGSQDSGWLQVLDSAISHRTPATFTTVSEDGAAHSFSVTGTDVDSGAVLTYSKASDPTEGSVTVASNGVVTFSPGAGFQWLSAGDVTSFSFDVKVTDQYGASDIATVSIEVHGVNDAPVAAALTATGGENQTLTLDVLASATDVDMIHALTLSSASVGVNQGSVSVVNNQLVFNPGADFNHLAAGQTQTVVVSYTVKDEFGAASTATETITVTGTNDAPVLSSAVSALTESNTALSTGGTLTISDVDDGEAHFVAQSGTAGQYGTFAIDANGAWTYQAAAHNEFKAGQTYSETFAVASADGTQTSVTVNIAGSNDAAVLSSATANLTETDAALSTSGTLSISDVDSAATFVAQAGTAGQYGTFAIDATGAWTYQMNGVHNELKGGQTVTETFAVASADGTQTSVTVNIAGSDDPTQIIVANAPSVTEDTSLSALVNMSLSDPDMDPSQLQFSSGSFSGSYGAISQNASGAWTYTLTANGSSAIQSLGAGMSLTDMVLVRASGGASAWVPVTINGTNDAPTAVATTYEPTIMVGQAMTFRDYASTAVDANHYLVSYDWNFGDGSGVTQSSAADVTHVYGGAGVFMATLRVTNDLGMVATNTIPITVVDPNRAPSDIIFTSNGAAVASGSVAENAAAGTVVANLSSPDPDPADWVTLTLTDSAGGRFALNAQNQLVTTRPLDYETSADRTSTVTVTATDDHGATRVETFQVNTANVNDAPTTTNAAVYTNVGEVITGQLAASAAAPGSMTFSLAANDQPSQGRVVINADGSFTYTPKALGHGVDHFGYVVTGPDGQTVQGQIAVDINSPHLNLPDGGSTIANSPNTTTHDQVSLAALTDGSFVASWMSLGQDGSGWGVYGQHYDASGSKTGGEFRINTTTVSDQYQPSVTGLADGSFVATWQSYGQDGSGSGVYGQHFNANGSKIGGEFQINTTTASDQ